MLVIPWAYVQDGDVDEVVRLLTAEPLLLELRDDLGDTALVSSCIINFPCL